MFRDTLELVQKMDAIKRRSSLSFKTHLKYTAGVPLAAWKTLPKNHYLNPTYSIKKHK